MTDKTTPFWRRLLKLLVRVAIVLAVLIIVIVVYAELKMRWTKRQVEAFSQLVIIGQPVAGLENKAKEMHLYYRHMGPTDGKDGAFVVWEGFVFDRWFCDVEYKDGKAAKKKITFLD